MDMKNDLQQQQNLQSASGQILSAADRKKAARRRHFTRSTRALFALLLALFAGLFLVACTPFKKSQSAADGTEKSKSKVDRKEHRKGMPVRDNIVE